MKQFTTPEVEVQSLNVEDVITTSGPISGETEED